jgi:hypothetical protein
MKKTLSYLLPLLLALATGCHNKSSTPDFPTGTFKGVFTRIQLKPNQPTQSYDTLKANLQLVLSPDSSYAVTGDTATVHAGSRGRFSVHKPIVTFYDRTFPIAGGAVKAYLLAHYEYTYDSKTLKISYIGKAGTSDIYVFEKVAD